MATLSQLRVAVAFAVVCAWLPTAAMAQEDALCADVVCTNPIFVVNRDMHDLTVAKANESVTATTCAETADFVNATDGTVYWQDCACGCGAACLLASRWTSRD